MELEIDVVVWCYWMNSPNRDKMNKEVIRCYHLSDFFKVENRKPVNIIKS